MLLLQGCGCSSVVEVWQAKLLLKNSTTTTTNNNKVSNTWAQHIRGTCACRTLPSNENERTPEKYHRAVLRGKSSVPKGCIWHNIIYLTVQKWTKPNQTINEEQEIKGVRRKGCNYKRDPWVTLVATDMLFMAMSMLLFCHWRKLGQRHMENSHNCQWSCNYFMRKCWIHL